jgi:hypothetical protein
MEFLFNLLRCIPGGGIFLWFAKVHSKRVESSFFYWNLFQLAIMAFQGAQLLYIPYPITGHWGAPCTPIGDETWVEVITSCLHWSEHMWLAECHTPCPVKGTSNHMLGTPPQLVMSCSRLELPGDRPYSNCLCGSITFSNPAALNSYVVHTQPRENLLIQMLGYIAPMSDVWIPSVAELSLFWNLLWLAIIA